MKSFPGDELKQVARLPNGIVTRHSDGELSFCAARWTGNAAAINGLSPIRSQVPNEPVQMMAHKDTGAQIKHWIRRHRCNR